MQAELKQCCFYLVLVASVSQFTSESGLQSAMLSYSNRKIVSQMQTVYL